MKLANATWLQAPPLPTLLDLLRHGDAAARVTGGAVRNSLLGEPVSDVDISTTMLPDKVAELLEAAEFKVIPTGVEHGTVTAVVDGNPYEITTLRSDIETNGRHAVVHFGRDWEKDALRRDFTINALYAGSDGTVFDPLDGFADIEARKVRFIGNAEDRILEDFLRILRFFRFFAWYCHGSPDREGLKACVRARDKLQGLSAERVWKELKKILAAPDPARAILWMRQAGILNIVLPESEKWGIDALPRIIAAQYQLGWDVDPLLRLMAIIPPQGPIIRQLGERLKLSKREFRRLEDWASCIAPSADTSEEGLAKILYHSSPAGIVDATRLELARLRQAGVDDDGALQAAAAMEKLLDFATGWKKPQFPVKGRDLINLGMKPGAEMGERLKSLEQKWIDSGFSLKKNGLLDVDAN